MLLCRLIFGCVADRTQSYYQHKVLTTRSKCHDAFIRVGCKDFLENKQ